jgi:aminoglycoside 6'-N-acetyltransferase I
LEDILSRLKIASGYLAEVFSLQNMVIRPFEARDTDAWAKMRARLWPDADAREMAREAAAFATGSKVPTLDAVLVAEDYDARPVGFIELAVRPFSDGCDSMPVPHIEGWYVEPAARGQGVGRALMRAAEEWSRARGFTELASDSELDDDAAQRAHASCGFEEVDRLVKFRKKLV